MKRTALARTTRVNPRRATPRRAQHPMPLPDGDPVTLAELDRETMAFGPQAELCRHTECVACFAVRHWRAGWPRAKALPWDELQTADVRVSDPHHEPHRGLKGESLDRDTIPLCRAHHTDGVGECVRHQIRSDTVDARRFYSLLPFDWRAARDEMRRRVAILDTTATEKP